MEARILIEEGGVEAFYEGAIYLVPSLYFSILLYLIKINCTGLSTPCQMGAKDSICLHF